VTLSSYTTSDQLTQFEPTNSCNDPYGRQRVNVPTNLRQTCPAMASSKASGHGPFVCSLRKTLWLNKRKQNGAILTCYIVGVTKSTNTNYQS